LLSLFPSLAKLREFSGEDHIRVSNEYVVLFDFVNGPMGFNWKRLEGNSYETNISTKHSAYKVGTHCEDPPYHLLIAKS
jgi:hypothetical protein